MKRICRQRPERRLWLLNRRPAVLFQGPDHGHVIYFYVFFTQCTYGRSNSSSTGPWASLWKSKVHRSSMHELWHSAPKHCHDLSTESSCPICLSLENLDRCSPHLHDGIELRDQVNPCRNIGVRDPDVLELQEKCACIG